MQPGQLRKSAGPAFICPKNAFDLGTTLNMARSEPLVDSRVLAQLLGKHHRNVMVLIQKHSTQFKRFSHTLFLSRMVLFGEARNGT